MSIPILGLILNLKVRQRFAFRNRKIRTAEVRLTLERFVTVKDRLKRLPVIVMVGRHV